MTNFIISRKFITSDWQSGSEYARLMLTGAAVGPTGAATAARKWRNNGCATSVATGYRSSPKFSLSRPKTVLTALI